MKNTLYLLIFATCVSTAQTTIEVNNNPNTTHLVAFINPTQDTLKLRSEHIIRKAEIFNVDMPFEYERYVYAKEVDIALKDIPDGRFIVNVSANRSMIILVLNKNRPSKKPGAKKRVVVKVPYDNTTSPMRRESIDSDTIFIKETREEFRERTLNPNGTKRD